MTRPLALALTLALLVASGCGGAPGQGPDQGGNSAGGGELSATGDQRVVQANRVVAAFCAGKAGVPAARRAASAVAGVVRREGPNATFYAASETTGRRPVGTVAGSIRRHLARCGGREAAAPLAGLR